MVIITNAFSFPLNIEAVLLTKVLYTSTLFKTAQKHASAIKNTAIALKYDIEILKLDNNPHIPTPVIPVVAT